MTKAAPDDHRPPLAQAAAWASRVMTVALEMVLPGLIGIWIDRKIGTKAVFTLAGFGLGFSVALWHLLQLTKNSVGLENKPPEQKDTMKQPKGQDPNETGS